MELWLLAKERATSDRFGSCSTASMMGLAKDFGSATARASKGRLRSSRRSAEANGALALTTGMRVNRESIAKMLGCVVAGCMAASAGEMGCGVELYYRSQPETVTCKSRVTYSSMCCIRFGFTGNRRGIGLAK